MDSWNVKTCAKMVDVAAATDYTRGKYHLIVKRGVFLFQWESREGSRGVYWNLRTSYEPNDYISKSSP
jgi:hypothetical protein